MTSMKIWTKASPEETHTNKQKEICRTKNLKNSGSIEIK